MIKLNKAAKIEINKMENQIVEVYGKKYEVILVPVEEVKDVEPKRKGGFIVDRGCNLVACIDVEDTPEYRNVFRTLQQAEACIAMAQLSQLIFEANEGWEPDWDNDDQVKFVIKFKSNIIIVENLFTTNNFLAFKTSQIAEKFVRENRELILTARPLL